MAIIKEINSSYGCSASYHRVVAISVNYLVKKVIICIASFVSKETRRQNCEPLDMVDVEVPEEDFPLFLNSNVIEAAYWWLKENAINFEDAEDDMESLNLENKEEKKDGTKEY